MKKLLILHFKVWDFCNLPTYFCQHSFWMTQTDMTIVVGSEDPTNPPSHRSKRKFVQKKKIKKVFFHPLFENPAAKFDLALVEIRGRFSFRDSRSPICIPDMVKKTWQSMFSTYVHTVPNNSYHFWAVLLHKLLF